MNYLIETIIEWRIFLIVLFLVIIFLLLHINIFHASQKEPEGFEGFKNLKKFKL